MAVKKESKEDNANEGKPSTHVVIKKEVNPQLAVTNKEYLQGLEEFANNFIKTADVPHKDPKKVVSIILYGKELGINPMVALNTIHAIQGRMSVGVSVFQMKLMAAGITYEVVDEFKPLFETVRVKPDGKGGWEHYDPRWIYPTQEDVPSDIGDDKVTSKPTPIDWVTRIKFTRNVFGREITHTESYKWSDAKLAGLSDKDNWKKMPKLMLRHRCFTQGARFFANDIMMGVYEMSEMADSNKVDYDITEEGEVTILPNEEAN